jgi:hypothetical protein
MYAEEGIDGEAYVELNEPTLEKLIVKTGPRVIIAKHIKSLQVVAFCVSFRLMKMVKCSKCDLSFNSVAKLCVHLKDHHILLEPCILQCAEDGCSRTFSNYNSFKKHLLNTHKSLPKTVSVTLVPELNNLSNDPTLCSVDDEMEIVEGNSTEAIFVPAVMRKQDTAARLILQLSASSSMTLSSIKYVQNSVTELFEDAYQQIADEIFAFLSKIQLDTTSSNVQTLLSHIRGICGPFDGIESKHKLLKYLGTSCRLIMPAEIKLGFRREGTASQKQVSVDDTFMYVSIRESVSLVLKWPSSWTTLVDLQEHDDQIMWNYFCGDQFRTLLSKMPNVSTDKHLEFYPIFIQLYYDDFEPANPLGSKSVVHKIGAFYFTILNFPHKYNAKLDMIHLLALVYTQDIKQYGMSSILQIFKSEILQLEKGFTMTDMNGVDHKIRVILAQVVGDNLGLHGLLGYTEGFRGDYCCDICLGTAADQQEQFRENAFVMRTVASYEEHVAQLSASHSSSFGIKSKCCLSELQFYHPATNFTCDVMHDLLEGVVQFEINLFLKHLLLKSKKLNLDDFNKRLRYFDYGPILSNSKPSEITQYRLTPASDSLGQHSHQTLVLMHILPLVLSDVLEVTDEHWHVVTLLFRICDIVFAPCVTRANVSLLADLIEHHHRVFVDIFKRPLKYKHHRMVHYPTLLVKNGPLLDMWVIRYEAKHNYFKRLAHIVCNFKNICKTMAVRNQIQQCNAWFQRPPFEDVLEIGPGFPTLFSQHKEFASIVSNACDRYVEVHNADWVKMCGTKYEPCMTVIADIDEDSQPVFGAIEKILVFNNEILLSLRKWKVCGFSKRLHCYSCYLGSDVFGIKQTQLFDFHPLYAHQCLDEKCTSYHIRLRHILNSSN